MDYYQKYLKYKNKYISLKNSVGGKCSTIQNCNILRNKIKNIITTNEFKKINKFNKYTDFTDFTDFTKSTKFIQFINLLIDNLLPFKIDILINNESKLIELLKNIDDSIYIHMNSKSITDINMVPMKDINQLIILKSRHF